MAIVPDLTSRLYWCRVMHERRFPKKHRFSYGIFMFWLDLAEIPILAKHLRLLGHNRFSPYSFFDQDHLPGATGDIRSRITTVVAESGVTLPPDARIWLLTNLRVFGYVFNPVSFYFCETNEGQPICAVSEIGNTFGEVKPFFLGSPDPETGQYRLRSPKHYYISPFTSLDGELDFRVKKPDARLAIAIDTHRGGEREVISMLTGHPVPITDRSLFSATFRCPLVTLKIIGLIHWHALQLFLKRIPFQSKEANPQLQRGVTRPHRSIQTN